MKITTTKGKNPKAFNRTLYTPHYRYQPNSGIESRIQEDIKRLIAEHDLTIWTPVENTTIEVLDGKAYGRTVVFRDLTSED